MAIPRGRQTYSRVASESDERGTTAPTATRNEEAPLPAAATALLPDNAHVQSTQEPLTVSTSTIEEATDDSTKLTVVILDPAHNRFSVSVNSTATIADLKHEGCQVHKVPAQSQRLIYMGKLLKDDDTLKGLGIVEDGTLLHLFPKPRVVVAATSSIPDACTASEQEHDNDNASSSGAHVPQIVLDPDEAERRSSILVLGSEEVMEAQNNVKLLSFLLLIISSMELLALFTIFLGVPEDEGGYVPGQNHTDNDFFNNDDTPGGLMPGGGGGEDMAMRSWQNSDYVDLAISSFGFYVATLGVRATTENTLRLASMYLYGTVIAAICWTVFYFLMNVKAEREAEQERTEQADDDFTPADDSDLYVQATFAVMLPALVWTLCCIRAWQFQRLLQEAEREAEERIRSEISDLEQGGATIIVNDSSPSGQAQSTNPPGREGDDHELSFQNASVTVV